MEPSGLIPRCRTHKLTHWPRLSVRELWWYPGRKFTWMVRTTVYIRQLPSATQEMPSRCSLGLWENEITFNDMNGLGNYLASFGLVALHWLDYYRSLRFITQMTIRSANARAASPPYPGSSPKCTVKFTVQDRQWALSSCPSWVYDECVRRAPKIWNWSLTGWMIQS